jgi:FMN phosphatase YigB (HAD superfamily)
MIRAVSFDYWDTLYDGDVLPARVAQRQAAIRAMVRTLGHDVGEEEFAAAYRESGREADRWWREEHRGYTTAERIRWMLERLGIRRPDDCAHISSACADVDAALLAYPPPLLPGARDMLLAVAAHFPLAIISDTGFASGRAQDALLAHDGLEGVFACAIYSMDVGHAKPHPAPFRAACDLLGVAPHEIIHIGDNERTDVAGALDAGLRAIRLDVVRQGGASSAELVARSFEELGAYLSGLRRPPVKSGASDPARG